MDRRKVVFGLILVLIGLLLLGRSFDLFYFTFGGLFRLLIPLAFILLGAWLIIRKKSQEDRLKAHTQYRDSSARATTAPGQTQEYGRTGTTGYQATGPQPAAPGADAEAGKIKYSKFLGDLFVDGTNVNLQNVEISMGVGDVEIKLHGGRLAPGLNRMIISGFIGDIRVFVPNNMPFHAHCSNFIGDIDAAGQRTGGLSNTIESQSANYDTAESKLYIAANNFIGDIKLFVV
jgi:lia operon protein LiaF